MILNEESHYKGIKLPKPQKHGNTFQRHSYAFLAAQKIVEENNGTI